MGSMSRGDAGSNYLYFGAAMLALLAFAYISMAPQPAHSGSSISINVNATLTGYRPKLNLSSPEISPSKIPEPLAKEVGELRVSGRITGNTAGDGNLALEISRDSDITEVYSELHGLGIPNATFSADADFAVSTAGMPNATVELEMEPGLPVGDTAELRVAGYFDGTTLRNYNATLVPYVKNFSSNFTIDDFGTLIMAQGMLDWDSRNIGQNEVVAKTLPLGLANVTFLATRNSTIYVTGKLGVEEKRKIANLSWAASVADTAGGVRIEAVNGPEATQQRIISDIRAIAGPAVRIQGVPTNYTLYADAPLNATADKIGTAIGAYSMEIRREMTGHVPLTLGGGNETYYVRNARFRSWILQPVANVENLRHQTLDGNVEAAVLARTVTEVKVSK